jgi:hypothetical protein
MKKFDYRRLGNSLWLELLTMLMGSLLIATALLADLLGAGGQSGFGLKQTILLVLGSVLLLAVITGLIARRYGWNPQIPTLIGIKTFTLKQWHEILLVFSHVRKSWMDVLIIMTLAGIVGFASYQGGQLIDPVIFEQGTGSVWFESDMPFLFSMMTDRNADDHWRISTHPLFSLVAYPPAYVLKSVLGVEQITAARIFATTVAILWVNMLFVILRLIGFRRFDAALFTMLGMTSASAMFWLVVLETYPIGSLSILMALAVVILGQSRKLSPLSYAVASALTLGFTFTNWMTGIIATMVNHSLKRTLQITINAFCIVVVLWMVEKVLFPEASFPFFFPRGLTQFILTTYAGGALNVLVSFVFHTMIMPAFVLVDRFPPDSPNQWPIMVTQYSLPGSGTQPWGMITVVLWGVLLGCGIWAFFRIKQQTRFRIALGLMILGQLILCLVYGEETFLYALHFAPLLLILAALSTLSRIRLVVLVLAGVLLVTMGINNGSQFIKATETIQCLKHNDVRTTATMEEVLAICGDFKNDGTVGRNDYASLLRGTR